MNVIHIDNTVKYNYEMDGLVIKPPQTQQIRVNLKLIKKDLSHCGYIKMIMTYY